MNEMTDFARDIFMPIQARASYRDGMAKSLARIVTDLVNEHESLLKAECDGDTVTVRERGGPMAFEFVVRPL
jgi:hypothetical protein